MSEILTNVGLNLPDQFTEDEFFEAGKLLSRIDQGMQWAIGDWYNAIPWGDKEAACERAGLNCKTAQQYGWVCGYYKDFSTRRDLKFSHHKALAIETLTPEQRSDLLIKAEDNKWSVARLTKERDKLLGKPEKVPLLSFDNKVDKLMETLPASTTKKMRKALDDVVRDLKHEFENEVDHVAKERMKEQRARVHQLEKEAREEKERLKALRMNLDGLMTEEEYRLIRGCLHPDRAPAEKKEQFGRAFEIFTRLEKTVNRDMPAELRRERGWS